MFKQKQGPPQVDKALLPSASVAKVRND
jgi:hypothetical protein